ncbi:TauD/TfdA family dioxygenase [Oceanicoccus sp. KOV_DT_Chl]|uniref:TauD/TfdA dioxygenase family protein n=1 Tax=Oceanicoccus sp. KOV_DT_Chl TaxID=1904639 RepID=UPI000C7DDB66|nr:TauD/TfdA family dioxygenase [Oceanicoccus sp. KOV_DT_Chl]
MSYQFSTERELPRFQHFTATPAAGALGAYIEGIDLNTELSDAAFTELYAAFLEYKVIFFRNQPMTEDQHLTLARRFGLIQGPGAIPQVEGYPQIKEQIFDEYTTIGSDVNYHADDTFRDYPSKMSILRALETPAGAGNTIWVDMEKAFNTLSEPMKEFLQGLSCIHNLDKSFGRGILEGAGGQAWDDMMKRNPPATHPLIVTHPETGRKSIHASQLTAVNIPELTEAESEAVLAMLMAHAYQPEFQCRFTWEENAIAIWDNRCLQHRGINDFSPAYRHMHRIAIVDNIRPSKNPAEQTPLPLDASKPYISVEDLYDSANKPELTYTESTTGNTEAKLSQNIADEGGDNDPVDAGFLEKMNSKKAGYYFTSGAAARIKKIPAMFRGAALRSIFKAAEDKGVKEINVAILQEVNAKRGKG